MNKLNKNKYYLCLFPDFLELEEIRWKRRKMERKKFRLNKDGKKKEYDLQGDFEKLLDKLEKND